MSENSLINSSISDRILALKPTLAVLTTNLQYERQPELAGQYGSHSKLKCQDEVAQYLESLAAAILVEEPSVFSNFIIWSNELHLSRNVPTSILIENLKCMGDVLRQNLPEDMQAVVLNKYLAAGLAVLK